jgi:hypothetical protein
MKGKSTSGGLSISVGDPDMELNTDPHVFGLPDPDPLVRGTDQAPDPAPDPSFYS